MENKKVLVVDDEQDCITFVESILTDNGLDVISASDGIAGLEMAKKENPDLVVLDVQMPKMDGFTVFKNMKADEVLKNIPVVMLTGVAEKTGISFSKKSMKEYFNEEPQGYVEKPIEPDKVLEAVKAALNI